jgi:hypothetical protein
MTRFEFALILTLLLLTGCSSGGSEDQSSAAAGKGADQSTAPHLRPTLRGDLERAGLAVSVARDHLSAQRWDDAASELRNAEKEIDKGLSRKPALGPVWEDARLRIQTAANMAENRSPETAAKVAEIITAIGALKVQTPE